MIHDQNHHNNIFLQDIFFVVIFSEFYQKGGKWLNKYLKYKQKYISLKKQLEN
jgi:hypothetical protein